MLSRTRWRVTEEPSGPGDAPGRWMTARSRGATGAVTSWGSGMRGRLTLRTYWEVREGVQVPEGEDLEEENWTPFWRQSLGVVRVSDRMVLVPAWDDVPEKAGCTLRIDPGMAFGAGDHPTTRLCLRILEALDDRGELPDRVLDVGTGTGVLALAAACLGARSVDALDIDPFGYAACRRNAALNRLEDKVHPVLLSLDLLERSYPLLLANIVASQISRLEPHLRARLDNGGRMILSGFDAHEEPSIREAVPMTDVQRFEEEGWVALLARVSEADRDRERKEAP